MENNKLVKLIVVPYNTVMPEEIEVLETYSTTSTGFDLTYVQNDKGPEPIHVKNLKNCAISEKIHIKTVQFEDELNQLKEKYTKNLTDFSLKTFRVYVDEEWTIKPSTKPEKVIKAEIKRYSKEFIEQTGYEFKIILKRHFIDEWSTAQIRACLLSLLLKVQDDFSIRKPHIDEVDQLVNQFGGNYLDKGVHIDDVLVSDFEFKKIEKAKKEQIELEIDEENKLELTE